MIFILCMTLFCYFAIGVGFTVAMDLMYLIYQGEEIKFVVFWPYYLFQFLFGDL